MRKALFFCLFIFLPISIVSMDAAPDGQWRVWNPRRLRCGSYECFMCPNDPYQSPALKRARILMTALGAVVCTTGTGVALFDWMTQWCNLGGCTEGCPSCEDMNYSCLPLEATLFGAGVTALTVGLMPCYNENGCNCCHPRRIYRPPMN